MMRSRSRARRRGGFTLIELLIVVAIIALLASLVLAGVVRVMAWQNRTATTSEITKMQGALQLAMSKYGGVKFLPSHLILLNDTSQYKNPASLAAPGNTVYAFTPAQVAAVQQTKTVFRYMFGRRFIEGGKVVNWVPGGSAKYAEIWGSECLVFYLGGMPTVGGVGCRGFSDDPLDPTLASVQQEPIGPFYEFKNNRLLAGATGVFYEYYDPYTTKYAYFGPTGPNGYSSDCPNTKGVDGIGIVPYYDVNQGTTPRKYFNPNLFQIISAGPDRRFGGGDAWDPKNGDPGTPTADNLVNFSQTQLSEPQH